MRLAGGQRTKQEVQKGRRTLLKKELLEKVASLEAEVARLREDSEKAEGAFGQERDRLLRALAQERNLRNRAAADELARLRFLKEQILSSFLPLLDDFDRALASQGQNPDSLRQGLEIILRQLKETLTSHGVEEMDSLGKPFDPSLHEAVGTRETPDLPEGTVAAVERKGFLLNGELLRPARVVVATKAATEESGKEPGEG